MTVRAGTIAWALTAAMPLWFLPACDEAPLPAQLHVANGDPDLGREAMRRYGCPACHTIPGIRGARGSVGPSLAAFGTRGYIGGAIANHPDNLIRWLQDPPRLVPNTAMPPSGVGTDEARHMAAYLYTLR